MRMRLAAYDCAGERIQTYLIYLVNQIVVDMKKPSMGDGFAFGGEGGIRTRGGMLSHTRFPAGQLKAH